MQIFIKTSFTSFYMTSLTFLGTGGDGYIVSRCIRNASGLVIQYDTLTFHIDPGPNALHSLRMHNLNVRAITAVLCTSTKLISSHDINAVIAGMTYEGVDITGVVVCPQHLISGVDGSTPRLWKESQEYVERVLVAEPEKQIGIEAVDIHFCESSSPDVLGLKMYFPDMVIGYPGDTSYTDKLARQYAGCDVLILHIQNPSGVKDKHCMSTDDAIRFVTKVKPQLAVLTRFGKAMLEQDPVLEARKVHLETGVQVVAAMDGQVISPASYSAHGKQRQLKGY